MTLPQDNSLSGQSCDAGRRATTRHTHQKGAMVVVLFETRWFPSQKTPAHGDIMCVCWCYISRLAWKNLCVFSPQTGPFLLSGGGETHLADERRSKQRTSNSSSSTISSSGSFEMLKLWFGSRLRVCDFFHRKAHAYTYTHTHRLKCLSSRVSSLAARCICCPSVKKCCK